MSVEVAEILVSLRKIEKDFTAQKARAPSIARLSRIKTPFTATLKNYSQTRLNKHDIPITREIHDRGHCGT